MCYHYRIVNPCITKIKRKKYIKLSFAKMCYLKFFKMTTNKIKRHCCPLFHKRKNYTNHTANKEIRINHGKHKHKHD